MKFPARRLAKGRITRTATARLLVSLGLSPNAVTIAGTCGVIIAAIGFAARGMFLPATIIGTVSAFGDLVDGEMARMTGRESVFGALLDAVCDRMADSAIFGSVAYWLLTNGHRRAGIAALLCFAFAVMVPYARAKAESFGLAGETGIAHRFMRLKLVAVGGTFGALGELGAMEVVLWLIACLSALTAYQRVRFAYQQLATTSEPNSAVDFFLLTSQSVQVIASHMATKSDESQGGNP